MLPMDLAGRSCWRRCSSIGIRRKKSGRQDSNLRPRAPGARALRKLSYTLKKILGEQDSNLRVSRLTGERLTAWLSPIESRMSGDNLAVTIAA